MVPPPSPSSEPGTAAIAAALPGAMAETGHFSLLYQPRIRLSDGSCTWVEALLRWHDPALGPVEPTCFIPVAEQLGLIGAITAWVLRTALLQARDWHLSGVPLGVSVNISATDLADAGFVSSVAALLAEAGLAGGVLELELTERMARDSASGAAAATKALAELGVAVAIDDFGIGHSNIADLRTLPVQVVKIDRSFVQDLAHSERDRVLLAGIARLGASMGCRVVAEGVESPEQLSLVRELGCHEAQGYAIARPMPPAELASWLAARKTKTHTGPR